jgi:hypothetical protein
MCMGLDRDRIHDLMRRLSGCTGLIWSKVLKFLSCVGVSKFFSQFSGGPQPSESMLCIGLR